jgi:IS5 family transposase
MIEMRRRQLSFGDGLIAQEKISDLRESWMIHADAVLANEDVVAAVYETLAKRHPRAVAAAVAALRPRWCCR